MPGLPPLLVAVHLPSGKPMVPCEETSQVVRYMEALRGFCAILDHAVWRGYSAEESCKPQSFW